MLKFTVIILVLRAMLTEARERAEDGERRAGLDYLPHSFWLALLTDV